MMPRVLVPICTRPIRAPLLAVALTLGLASTGHAETQVVPGAAPQLHHIIERGDALMRIARAYHTTVDELRRLNGLVDDHIVVGRRLRVPWPDVALRDAETVHVSVHRVLPGESLGSIAERYGADPKTVQLFNELRGSTIRIGERLRIPSATPALRRERVPYLVEHGDTRRWIAEKHDMPQRHLRHLNPSVAWASLQVGDEISVYRYVLTRPAPPAEVPAVASPAVTDAAPEHEADQPATAAAPTDANADDAVPQVAPNPEVATPAEPTIAATPAPAPPTAAAPAPVATLVPPRPAPVAAPAVVAAPPLVDAPAPAPAHAAPTPAAQPLPAQPLPAQPHPGH